ncbi:MAG TPA: hypothetical protein VHR55_08290 [Candidatus Limnocylindria bacterium]|nr:hypothetical protein [Candidatus Limnocylindria bacterium]
MSTWISLSRAALIVIGGGALVMAVGGLTSGSSITDPVFPAGLALGVLALGAGAFTESPVAWRAAVTWLGVAATIAAVARFGILVFGDPDIGPDVYPYFLVPAAVVLVAVAGVVAGRIRAGVFGGRRASV